MTSNPYGESLISYDGQLLPFSDIARRYKRDKEIQAKYVEAEENRHPDQLSWDDVTEMMSE